MVNKYWYYRASNVRARADLELRFVNSRLAELSEQAISKGIVLNTGEAWELCGKRKMLVEINNQFDKMKIW